MNTSRKILGIHILSIIIITVVLILLLSSQLTDAMVPFAIGFIVLAAMGVIYGVTTKYIDTDVEGKTQSGNPYHRFFFAGTGMLTMVLTVLGLLSALFVYFEYGNLFQALGLVVSVIWVAVFLRYFMWSVYHYNINYGLTDKDWDKIFEAREKAKMGFPVSEQDLKAPEKNPYRSQTFGLPPGTVRGMIAFTLLFGGLSLLIVSFGTEYSTSNQLAIIRQQFEFFETAFLMMIAFYFGDKSLKYLQRRWSPPARSASETTAAKGPARQFNELQEDDLMHEEEETEFEQTEEDKTKSALSYKRKALSMSLTHEQVEDVKGGFVQVKDNIFSKILSDEEIEKALQHLQKEEQIELAMPVVKAVVEVESSGRGHLPDGRPKILFEGHKFWFWLEKFDEDPEKLQKKYPNIIYKTWTTKHYLGGASEYKRLEAAKKIHSQAAIYATSWGLLQILGENLEHHIRQRVDAQRVAQGDKYYYRDYEDFEEKQAFSEYYHLLDFLSFIKTKTVKGKPLIHYISEENRGDYDWATFAYGYNGKGYKENGYDKKLKVAYKKYQTMKTSGIKEHPTALIHDSENGES